MEAASWGGFSLNDCMCNLYSITTKPRFFGPCYVNERCDNHDQRKSLPRRCIMPDILIHCPVTDEPVPTRLDTETIVFETLPSIAIPF